MEIKTTQKFDKDFKKLKKKFQTLHEDFKVFIDTSLKLFHEKGIEQDIRKFTETNGGKLIIYKARKFACRSLKGKGSRSGIRVIYAFYPDNNKIEFIEIYFKGEKENEDKKRIEEYLKQIE